MCVCVCTLYYAVLCSLISPSDRSASFVFPPHLLPVSLFRNHQIGSSWLHFRVDNLLSYFYFHLGLQINDSFRPLMHLVLCDFCFAVFHIFVRIGSGGEKLTSCDRFVVIGFRTLSRHDRHVTTTCIRICICVCTCI